MNSLTKRQITSIRQLTPQQRQRFVEEYVVFLDVGQAAVNAGIPAAVAVDLLGRSKTQQAITIAKVQRSSRTEIYADEVLRRWYMLATADARELSMPIRVNCRHCHGFDHRYQFTADELRTARQSHEVKQLLLLPEFRVPFDDLGGDGFNLWGDLNPSCTECGGKGVPAVWVEDARNLSPAAALLYDGVEVSRDGAIKIKLRDRGWADQMVAAHLGLTTKREPVPVDPARMSDEQLDMAIQGYAVNLNEEEFREVSRELDLVVKEVEDE